MRMKKRSSGLVIVGSIFLLLVSGTASWAQFVCTETIFDDVNEGSVGLPFCHYIERFYQLGITGGCRPDDPVAPGNQAMYCPDTSVTRGQMAIFLTSALDMVPDVISEGSCATGQVLKKTATGFTCSDDLSGSGTPSATATLLDGTSSAGAAAEYSRGDHKHGIGAGAITTTHILDGTISNADISPSAAIDFPKLSGVAAASHDHDALYVNEGQAGSITSAMIADGTIMNADISPSAAIDISKLSGVAVAGHNHDVAYVNATGDSMSGAASGAVLAVTNSGTVDDVIGVLGNGEIGVKGVSAADLEPWMGNAAGVFGQFGEFSGWFSPGNAGVRGDSKLSIGVLGTTDTGTGVKGYASQGAGVFGSASVGRGVYGDASATGDAENYGGHFRAAGNYGTGVQGEASATGNAYNYGGFFSAAGNGGTGVYGRASATGDVTNYGGIFHAGGNYGHGVNAIATGSSGTGVYGYGADYDFYAAGPNIHYGQESSIRWKKNIIEIDHALDKVVNLRGVYFDWDEEHGGQHDMGFIAEEVGKVIPEIVGFEPDGVYATGVDYGAITPMLVQAIKEQQKQIEQLKAQIEELRRKIE